MSSIIRAMVENDRAEIKAMMHIFYSSPAVHTNGSEEIFDNDIDNCVNSSPYLEGYVFEENGVIQGYAMLAKSFSTEFGKMCIWIEDIYFKPECRGMGIGSRFIEFVKDKYHNAVLRLEVEEENERAVRVYKKGGFEFLPYMEMVRR